jgi:hypothetical protein
MKMRLDLNLILRTSADDLRIGPEHFKGEWRLTGRCLLGRGESVEGRVCAEAFQPLGPA